MSGLRPQINSKMCLHTSMNLYTYITYFIFHCFSLFPFYIQRFRIMHACTFIFLKKNSPYNLFSCKSTAELFCNKLIIHSPGSWVGSYFTKKNIKINNVFTDIQFSLNWRNWKVFPWNEPWTEDAVGIKFWPHYTLWAFVSFILLSTTQFVLFTFH